jgi:hypothetical protein
MKYDTLIPTSDPDLFVGINGRLVHRVVGPLSHDPTRFLTMPDGTTLRVYSGAPAVSLHIPRVVLRPQVDEGDEDGIGVVIGNITKYASDASGYIAVAEVAIKLLDLLLSMVDDAKAQLSAIDQKLNRLMVEVGANDYLALMRRMSDMRGNADAIIQTLAALRTLIEGSDPERWYRDELKLQDAQLHADINALLDAGAGYFRRTYVESLIAGDGNWMAIIADRPVDGNGTTFEYRLALPTVLYLISVRLAMMKFTVPNFVAQRTFSVEIDNWWRRLQQLSAQMAYFIRETPTTPVEVQSARRQSGGGQVIGQYQQWETHCFIPPPNSVSPVGAIDITTGFGSINWDYEQFDEWYLSQGDLHGGNAGYWPPSVGPKWYQPPPNATGLPPLEQAIQAYQAMAESDARTTAQRVADQIGVGGTSIFAWTVFDFAYPPPPPQLVQVPNVIGLGRTEAEDRLEALGLRHIARLPFGVEDGRATDQSPAAGTAVEQHSIVTVTYPTPLGPLDDQGPFP